MEANAWGWQYSTARRQWLYYDENGGNSHSALYLRKLKVSVPFETIKGRHYSVTWDEYSYSVDDGTVSYRSMSDNVHGVGGSMVREIIVEPPPFNGFRWLANVKVCEGQGASRFGPRDSACCGGVHANSGGQISLQGGPTLAVDLGSYDYGISSGVFGFTTHEPTPGLADGSLLEVIGASADAEPIRNSAGKIVQVKTSQRLVHLDYTTDSSSQKPNGYVVHLYGPTSAAKVNGLYPLAGLNELARWQVSVPDVNLGNYNQVLILEGITPAPTKTFTYQYSASPMSWTLLHPDSLMKERHSVTKQTVDGIQHVVQSYDKLDPVSGVVLYHEESVYLVSNIDPENFNYEQTASHLNSRLFSRTVGVGADAVTTYFMERDTYNREYEQIGPGGEWIHVSRGSYGRVWKIESGLAGGDFSGRVAFWHSLAANPPYYHNPSGGTYYDPAEIRRTTFEFFTADEANDPSSGSSETDVAFQPTLWRTKSEYVADVLVGRTKRVIHGNPGTGIIEWEKEYRLHSPDAELTDSGNLVSETVYYTTGSFVGHVKSVKSPDGTMQLYTYSESGGQRTTTVESGLPNGAGTAITRGTRTISVINAAGVTVSETSIDIASGLTTSSVVYDNFDSRGRPQRRHDALSGLSEWSYYDCCVLSQTVNREGVATVYGYDAMKRLETSTTAGITTINTYDKAGNLKKVERQGSSGGVMTIAQYTYDTAGRMITQSDGLNNLTAYNESYVNGALVRTTTEASGTPDAVTRIERYYLGGELKETGGTAANPIRYVSGLVNFGDEYNPDYRTYRSTINLTADGTTTGTNEWTLALSDFLGRPYKTLYADATPGDLSDNPASESFYDTAGRLSKQVDPDGVTTLYLTQNYNEQYVVQDMDRDGVIDWAGPDRITKTVSDVATQYGSTVRRSTVSEYRLQGNASAADVSVSSSAVNGLRSWSLTVGAAAPAQTLTEYLGSGNRRVTSTAPDGSYVVQNYSMGRLQNVMSYGVGPVLVGQTTYTYDQHGRQFQVIDVRNGAVAYAYDAADRVTSVTNPPAAAGHAPQIVTSVYDGLGRVKQVLQPDGGVVHSEYFPSGQLKKTYGSRTYPVEYFYDALGRMKTMKTWQDYAGSSGLAITTWDYDPNRGWLTSKRYNKETVPGESSIYGPDYTYTVGGRMKTRKWARTGTGGLRVTTTWTYGFEDSLANNDSGDVVSITYANDPQATPSVTYTYDRCGHPNSVVRDGITTTLTTTLQGSPWTESHSGGSLSGMSLSYAYDAQLRPQSVIVLKNGVSQHAVTYGYDAASRLSTVTSGSDVATYGYVANSPLVGQIEFREDGTPRLTTTKTYDFLNRVTAVNHTPTGAGAVADAYAYNAANQRVRKTAADGSQWLYNYDTLGQVTSGKKFWNDSTPVAGEQFEYAYDDIGNRKWTKRGGDETGLATALRSATYTPNLLNQYSSRTVPPAEDVLGVALATSTVTVGGQSGVYRKGEFFRKELPAANGSAPVWLDAQVVSPGQTTVPGFIYVPKTPESYTYDLDGNLLSDGRWNYTWDAENRVVKMESISSVPSNAKRQLLFSYDWRSRRIRKVQNVWNGSAYAWFNEVRYVYDGWNLLAELDGSLNPYRHHAWGLDLSGSQQGAGGVGGLLFTKTPSSGNHFVAPDANGNVVALVKGSDGALSARYEYGPFGELLVRTGTMAAANPFRFSTKYHDDESDLLYYGYRFYNPSSGRWINRDPSEEHANESLYSFVGNNGLNRADMLGLYQLDFHYYAIYYLARAAGHSRAYASLLGGYSQFVDDNPDTDPILLGAMALWDDKKAQRDLAWYHFTGSTPTKMVTENDTFWRAYTAVSLSVRPIDFRWAGETLHTYADSFSHAGFTGYRTLIPVFGGGVTTVGHLAAGTAPDLPYLDVRKAMKAAQSIYEIMPKQCDALKWTDISKDLFHQFSTRGDEGVRCEEFKKRIMLKFGDSTSR